MAYFYTRVKQREAKLTAKRSRRYQNSVKMVEIDGREETIVSKFMIYKNTNPDGVVITIRRRFEVRN